MRSKPEKTEPTHRRPSPRAGPARAATIADIVPELARTFDALRGVYEQILTTLGDQRRALGKADARALETCSSAMATLDRRLRELDTNRRRLTEQAIVAGSPGPTVAAIARCAGERTGEALSQSAARLRECLERVHREQLVLRQAVTGVLGHLQGLWTHVGRTLDQTGTYAENPRVTTALPGGLAIDLTR